MSAPPPDYRRPRFTGTNFKKGWVQAHVARTAGKLSGEDKEKAAEAAAKKRDRAAPNGCRWIHRTRLEREACRRARWREAMHWKAKSLAPAAAAKRRNIITGCPLTHQGPASLHAGRKKIEPLEPKAGMDGPIICYERASVRHPWIEVGRETHVGVQVRAKLTEAQQRQLDAAA